MAAGLWSAEGVSAAGWLGICTFTVAVVDGEFRDTH